MRVPFLCIAVALAAGALLAGHSQWATVFVVIQTAVFMLWFFREHGKEQWTDFGRTMVRVFTNNP
jgi:Flp pilus assembly protein TadB